MADATWAISSFLGGEISKFAQGRFDKPDYRISMNVCLNAFPGEIGPWMRRPGTRYAGHTRGGADGRTIKFDFEQSAPVTLEFIDGNLRFRQGAALVTTNDAQAIVAISTANPGVVQTGAATNWVTGNTVLFSAPSTPLLENRQFVAIVIDSTHFSLIDGLTTAAIDGSTLGALASAATVSRVHELVTPYAGGAWANVRAVQAETTCVLLCPGVAPQALTVTTMPSAGVNPQFALAPATFNDGPYLDPFTNGVQATPGAVSGIVGITLAFPAYSATIAYAKGSFVTASSVNYVSLSDQNVGNAPSSSPSFWAATGASAAINGGQGFIGTDVGRLVRLFSEPPLWQIESTYAIGAVVAYNPSGLYGEATYWQSLTVSNVGHAPGSDLTNWEVIPQGAAIWTWGKIVSFTNIISPSLSGSTSVGDMTTGGGLAAAFNGVFAQPAASSAEKGISGGALLPNAIVSITSFVGKNYTGASSQKIQSATIYPSSDNGLAFGSANDGAVNQFTPTITLNLRASATAPASSSSGALLSTSGPISNGFSAVTLNSNDQSTAWAYVWIEQITTAPNGAVPATSYTLANAIGQVSFFAPPGTGVASGVDVEILGPALLYTAPVLTWRLGSCSNTTGFPTCGCYDDGRLWLGGVSSNHFDTSTSNGIVPGSSVVNFAPTDQYGVVSADSAISETLNSDSSNPIFWMMPDLQGVLMGTQAGEFLVLAPTSGSIAPNNITSRRGTAIGSENVEPIRTDHTILFVKRYARKLIEYFADVFSGKFSGPNLADKAEHIVRAGIAEIRYTDATTPIAWGRNTDGSWFGVTYKRDALTTSQGPTNAAFHRHSMGSGRIVQSLCAGPSVNGELDSLTMVTNDPSTSIRYVEVMTDTMDELSSLSQAWFLDCAVNPTSISSTSTGSTNGYGALTINGLWHLNGKTVQVFAAGLDCGDPGEGKPFSDFTVSNGSITIPYGDSISAGPGRGLLTAAFVAGITLSQIVVGFTYNSDGQMVRPISPQDTGARNGPALGKKRRNHRYAALLNNTLGISFGTSFSKLQPAAFKLGDDITNIPALTMFSGVYQAQPIDDYSFDGMLCWRVSRPFPATVVAVSGNIQTQDQ